jgi:ketosteroid isomerase-like protein
MPSATAAKPSEAASAVIVADGAPPVPHRGFADGGPATVGGMTEDRLAALERAVRRLSDLEDIRALRLRYHDAINEGRAGDIPALFTEDGEVDFGYLGRSRNVPKFFAAIGNVLDSVTQFVHNHVVEVDGDTATGSSYLEAKSISKGVAYRVVGRYLDEYRRTPEGWRFTKMTFVPTFTLPFDQAWVTDDPLRMGR